MFRRKKDEEGKTVETQDASDVTTLGAGAYSDSVKVEVATTVTDTPDEIDGTNMPEEIEPAPLTRKEAKALKKSRYSEKIANNDRFKKIYIIRNKKTNQVVELRAASSVHAANIIGWRLRKIEVLDVRDVETPSEEPETAGSST